jgi:peptidoglycan/LPS O-acetylase OafA/YrhL
MVFLRGTFDVTSSHFWSLSMEEQFYVIWPFIILSTPRKYLLKVILATVALAVISRFGCYFIGLNSTQVYVFPLTSLDALGLGALLAFFTHYQKYYNHTKQNLCNFGLWICFPILIFFIILELIMFKKIEIIEVLLKPTILALFYVWLVSRAAEGFGGLLGKILELKPLVFIGKISYGLYIYHYFMIPVTFKLLQHLDSSNKIPVTLLIITESMFTFAIAVISWFLIEKPINNLKHQFSYERTLSNQR